MQSLDDDTTLEALYSNAVVAQDVIGYCSKEDCSFMDALDPKYQDWYLRPVLSHVARRYRDHPGPLAEVARRMGLPPGVLNIVFGLARVKDANGFYAHRVLVMLQEQLVTLGQDLDENRVRIGSETPQHLVPYLRTMAQLHQEQTEGGRRQLLGEAKVRY
ncbi:hypothetical protein KW786_01250, partial [Candidatus Parcubacteria bacterium]|nr:hypothetical protein [Candidatus Parcubacteria bacterium]